MDKILLDSSFVIALFRKNDSNHEIAKKIFQFIKDNFKIIIETTIPNYDDEVFSFFKKFNNSTYKASYTDCSCILVYMNFNLDYIVSFDKFFEKYDGIRLLELKT